MSYPQIGNPSGNKGYFKHDYIGNITFGTYVKSPDKSMPWSNNIEIGGYLGGGLKIGNRTTVDLGITAGGTNTILNSDIEDVNTRKNTYTVGMNLSGKVAVTDNIAFTASAGFKTQGYENHARMEYMDESAYVEDGNGFGSWQYPGETTTNYGTYMSFQDAMDEYNDSVTAYNHEISEMDEPKCAGQLQVSGGIEFTNNNNTVTGGVKGIYTRYSGFGNNKVTGNNYAAELYGSVDVGHGIKINGAVNTNKVATVGVSITGLLD